TDSGSVAANPDLAGALDCTYGEMDFTAYDQTCYRARGEYYLWHSERLLTQLRERLERRGGRIAYGQQFYSIEQRHDSVVALVNDRAIRSRLLLDCMGYASPIVHAKDVARTLGYYLLYGATFRQSTFLVPVALHNMMLSAHPGYIEAFPTSDGHLHLVLIVPAQQLRSTSDLKADFSFIVSKSPYAKHIDSPVSPERRFLGGIVPVGRMRRTSLDHMFFYGEAGQVNPAASATALTRMLLDHRAVADHLSACLNANALSAADLARRTHAVGIFNQRLQRALFRSILRWKSDDFKRVIEELIRIDDTRLVNSLVFGDLPEDWMSIAALAKRLMKHRSTTLLAAVARAALPLAT
ncbi:MAG TPA: hypothetical protein VF057_10405, partial [Thermoanaerobaculia bacterium]